MSPSIQQKFALDQELLNAVRIIQAGFGQLQKLDRIGMFIFLCWFSASSGKTIKMITIGCILSILGQKVRPKGDN